MEEALTSLCNRHRDDSLNKLSSSHRKIIKISVLHNSCGQVQDYEGDAGATKDTKAWVCFSGTVRILLILKDHIILARKSNLSQSFGPDLKLCSKSILVLALIT
jgi:hypothetical protein